jgi:putative sterol carrier protein
MTLKEAISKIKNLDPKALGDVEGRFAFLIKGGDPEEFSIVIEEEKLTVFEEKLEYDCYIETDIETFHGIIDTTISPLSAFMTGKIRLSGDLSFAMKLNRLFGGV